MAPFGQDPVTSLLYISAVLVRLNSVEVLQKVSLKDIPGSPTLFADILVATARGAKRNGNNKGSRDDQLSTMRISDLREEVHNRGLDVDGSRETLIATLKESS